MISRQRVNPWSVNHVYNRLQPFCLTFKLDNFVEEIIIKSATSWYVLFQISQMWVIFDPLWATDFPWKRILMVGHRLWCWSHIVLENAGNQPRHGETKMCPSWILTLKALNILIKNMETKGFLWIWNHHKWLSYLLLIHLNTYVMGLRPLCLYLLARQHVFSLGPKRNGIFFN